MEHSESKRPGSRALDKMQETPFRVPQERNMLQFSPFAGLNEDPPAPQSMGRFRRVVTNISGSNVPDTLQTITSRELSQMGSFDSYGGSSRRVSMYEPEIEPNQNKEIARKGIEGFMEEYAKLRSSPGQSSSLSLKVAPVKEPADGGGSPVSASRAEMSLIRKRISTLTTVEKEVEHASTPPPSISLAKGAFNDSVSSPVTQATISPRNEGFQSQKESEMSRGAWTNSTESRRAHSEKTSRDNNPFTSSDADESLPNNGMRKRKTVNVAFFGVPSNTEENAFGKRKLSIRGLLSKQNPFSPRKESRQKENHVANDQTSLEKKSLPNRKGSLLGRLGLSRSEDEAEEGNVPPRKQSQRRLLLPIGRAGSSEQKRSKDKLLSPRRASLLGRKGRLHLRKEVDLSRNEEVISLNVEELDSSTVQDSGSISGRLVSEQYISSSQSTMVKEPGGIGEEGPSSICGGGYDENEKNNTSTSLIENDGFAPGTGKFGDASADAGSILGEHGLSVSELTEDDLAKRAMEIEKFLNTVAST